MSKDPEIRIIAGPCAIESREHMHITIAQAKALGISQIRCNLWKPRTVPGYEGEGEKGIPWIQEAAEDGLDIAMEVIQPEHMELLVREIIEKFPHTQLLAWIGSRNQNHRVQQAIGEVAAPHDRVLLMAKNQMWPDATHWKGIIAHLIHAGVPRERLLLCHRGFHLHDNTPLRNTPDWEMAEDVQRDLGLPMLVDPSHIGGRQDLVAKVALQAALLPWVSGQLIEVHPDPYHARTDAPQQLDWDQMTEIHPLLVSKNRG